MIQRLIEGRVTAFIDMFSREMDYENEEYDVLVNWLHGIFIQLYCDVINSFAQNYN